jgi:septum formation protein
MSQDIPRIVLASASAVRRRLLTNAGIAFTVDPADIDEPAVKSELRARHASSEETATELALRKARLIAGRHPDALVIGADQILVLGDAWFDKPPDRAAATRHLKAMSGRTHKLISAVVVLEGRRELWKFADTATLDMRTLSDAFIDRYLDEVGPAVFTTVGAYQLEGLGSQLFDRVAGDFFTVLGLPLLPLLGFLRHRGIITA